jgi:hypothetical protein
MTIDVDNVATDSDLSDEIGGQPILSNLIPVSWENSAEKARQGALKHILKHLARRVPPITESDLLDEEELKECVIWGSLAHLYRINITGGPDDPNAKLEKKYASMFSSELNALSPTVSSGERANSRSIAFHRR